ncbi:uncharacterized protein N7482_003333 [Penicillium canariense]|uniref:Uncharacterized protein n=1 Tax=Penicillium canariense TaxID=189055 RepID=A0A9W9LNA7_9EURO|nr:uncharacterized protein N7482_003333 [Penicillium canariense]KAJ5167739.1 hypothetical protein N7482_003333 [Penicillium canariense]
MDRALVLTALSAQASRQNAYIQKVAKEQRLSETESALYSALVTLRAMRPVTVVQASAKPDSVPKQKAARMEEWSQLPLRGWPDMERWLAGMCDQFTIDKPQSSSVPVTDPSGGGFAIPPSPSHGSTNSGVDMEAGELTVANAWLPRGNISIGSPYETHLHPSGLRSSPVYPQIQATGESDVASPTGGMAEYTDIAGVSESGQARPAEAAATRAEELSKSRPNIYF